MFTYQALSPQHIRVVRVLPSTSADQDLVCEFHDRELSQSGPEYAALSYVWGDPKFDKRIMIDRQEFFITESLDYAMRVFRATCNLAPDALDLIWIDQICIDQQDVQERNEQVAMMSQIYTNAKVVFVSLGNNEFNGGEKGLHLM